MIISQRIKKSVESHKHFFFLQSKQTTKKKESHHAVW